MKKAVWSVIAIVLQFLWTYIVITCLWRALEWWMYGEVTVRAVDSIVTVIMSIMVIAIVYLCFFVRREYHVHTGFMYIYYEISQDLEKMDHEIQQAQDASDDIRDLMNSDNQYKEVMRKLNIALHNQQVYASHIREDLRPSGILDIQFSTTDEESAETK